MGEKSMLLMLEIQELLLLESLTNVSFILFLRFIIELACDALSRDHKPDDKQEAEVIISSGGRIDSYRDSHGNALGPLRVWLLHENIPGLAMTRSFGDMMAARVGVSAIPEFTELELTPCDKFIVLASDGIWEFL